MIRDIIFEQNYAKKVNEHVELVGKMSYQQGRQQGWNEIISVIQHLATNNIEISLENVVEGIQHILEQENSPNDNQPTPPKTKSPLSVIK